MTFDERIGFVLSGMHFGLLLSPFLAGAVYERAGYDAVFAVILGVIGFDFVLRVAMIEKRVAARWLEKDTFPEAVVPSGESSPWNSDSEHCSSSPTATEDEEPNDHPFGPDENSPLLPSNRSGGHGKNETWFASKFPTAVALFSSPSLNAAVFGGFSHTMLIVAFDTILPLFVMKTFHWKATASGLIFLAITVPSLLSTFIGMLSDRYGARITSLSGFAIVTPALGLLGLCKDDSVRSQALLVLLLVLIGECALTKDLLLVSAPSPSPIFREATWSIIPFADHRPSPSLRARSQLDAHPTRSRRLFRSRKAECEEPLAFWRHGRFCAGILPLHRCAGTRDHCGARAGRDVV